jgi:hypothetical protein
MGGIGIATVVMSAPLAGGGSCDAMPDEDVGCHLKPSRVVVAIAVKHRCSRERLHGQSQQQQGESNFTDAFSHEKSIALSKPRLVWLRACSSDTWPEASAP